MTSSSSRSVYFIPYPSSMVASLLAFSVVFLTASRSLAMSSASNCACRSSRSISPAAIFWQNSTASSQVNSRYPAVLISLPVPLVS